VFLRNTIHIYKRNFHTASFLLARRTAIYDIMYMYIYIYIYLYPEAKMSYDPECRKATRCKINVVVPCVYIYIYSYTGQTGAGRASEKAWPTTRHAVRDGKRSGGGGV